MNVTCPSCHTVFRVDPAKVPEAGVRARCTVCEGVFGVYRDGEGARPRPRPRHSPSPFTGLESVPEAPAPAPLPKATPVRPEPVVPPSPPPAAPAAPRPRPIITPPPVTPPVVVRPSVSPAGARRLASPPGTTAAPAKPAAPPAGRGAAINPFLSQDPKQKARRLARALVSDLVVYHPERRARGLREGTLKELFEEEIKKSWDEYEDQVGAELAESTSYFSDALNEILGDGSQIF